MKKVIEVLYQPGYFDGAKCKPLQILEQGDWIDLYCAEDTQLAGGVQSYINLGVSMKLPAGYEAIIAPRSSTFKHWGILQTNSIGVIDSTYCGNDDVWMMPVYPTETIFIPKGTRICQFRIQKIQPELKFVQVETLKGTNRGGLGSTGL